MPLLPMLEKEACAQFYGDKNMWRNAARDRVLLLSILFKKTIIKSIYLKDYY